jgi:hypothetical protein
MKGEVQKKYYIGDSKPGSWSSVYAYRPHNPEILKSHGEIFAVIALTGPASFNVATAGNLLLDHLHETYFENQSDSTLIALEKAMVSINKHLQKLLENDSAAEAGIDIELTIMVLFNDIAYLGISGAGHVYLFRDGNISEITKALKDPTGEGYVRVASLVLKRADVFMLGTPIVSDEFTTEQLLELAVDFTDLPLKKRSFEDPSQLALVMIGYNIDRSEAKAEALMQKELEHNHEQPEMISNAETTETGLAGTDEVSETDQELQNEPGREESDEEMQMQEDGEKIPVQKKLAGMLSGLTAKVKTHGAKFKDKIQNRRTPGESHAVRADEQIDFQQPTYKVVLQQVKVRAVKVIRLIKETVWDNWLGMGKGGIYLKGSGRGRNWRFIVVVIIVVVAVLYFSLKGISERNQRAALENDARLHITSATAAVDDVGQLAQVVAKSDTDQTRKQELLSKLASAKAELAQAKTVGIFLDEISPLEDKIDSLTDLLNRTIAVKDLQPLVDLGGLFPGAIASDLAGADSSLYISDSAYGKIYKTDYSGNSLKEVASGFTKPRSITLDDKGNIIVLDENGDNRIAIVSPDGTVARQAGTSEFRVGNVPQIEFANIFGGRIYGVDKNIKSVIALQRSESGYGVPEKRFTLDGFDTAKDIQVSDLKIYVLAAVKQGIYRALNNKDDTPVLTGLNQNEDLFAATAMYINDVNVFIADPANQRVLVFNKDVTQMSLKAQYVFKGNAFKDIKEIYADREKAKLFVLDGTSVYVLDLNKLAQF